jgi:hypothetical protein
VSGFGARFEALGRVGEEVVDEERDVLAALVQRRDLDLDHAQAIVQILAEAAAGHGGLEVVVGRRDQTDVDADRLVAADALEFLFLDRAQELRLGLERHVADLVEEERAAVRGLELALRAVRARP